MHLKLAVNNTGSPILSDCIDFVHEEGNEYTKLQFMAVDKGVLGGAEAPPNFR